MKIVQILKNRWHQYRRKKRWWSIMLDFILLTLIIVMLIPSARSSFSVFVVKNTMLSPRESNKTVILSEKEWGLCLINNTGNKIFLSEFMDKPLIINFWATWCSPCIAELPSFQKLYDKYKQNVHFVFIVNEPNNVINSFLEKKNFTIPCFRVSGDIPEMFETGVIPSTYLIHHEHLIVNKTGAARWDSGKIMRLLDNLINDNHSL